MVNHTVGQGSQDYYKNQRRGLRPNYFAKTVLKQEAKINLMVQHNGVTFEVQHS